MLPSEYLKDAEWVDTVASVIHGVKTVGIDAAMCKRADALALALEQRLDMHITYKVDLLKQHHWDSPLHTRQHATNGSHNVPHRTHYG